MNAGEDYLSIESIHIFFPKNASYFRNKLYKNRTFVIVTYLRIVAKLCLIIEDVQIGITVLG